MSRHSPQVLDHFDNPRNLGSFADGESGVLLGTAGSAAEGELIRLQIKIENGRIVASRFKAFGCTSTIAAASWLSDHVLGQRLDEVGAISATTVRNALDLADDKQRIAELAVAAIRSATDDRR